MTRSEKIIFWSGVVFLIFLFSFGIWPVLAFLAWYVKRIPDKRLPLTKYLASNQKKFYDWLSDFFWSWFKSAIMWTVIGSILAAVIGTGLWLASTFLAFPVPSWLSHPIFLLFVAYMLVVVATLYALSNTKFDKWDMLFWQAEPTAEALVGRGEYETMLEEDKNRVKRNVVDSLVGINKATLVVAGGKILVHNPPAGDLARFGGTGILVVQEGHAVVLERGGRRSCIVGTGVWHLGMFERINMVIPLTQRAIPIEVENVVAQDHFIVDRIKLLAFTRLDAGDKSHENGDYPFDDKVINNLVWSPEVGPEVLDWSDVVRSIASAAIRNLVAGLSLDDLVLASGEAREKLHADLKDAINRIAKDKFGVVVSSIDFGEIAIDVTKRIPSVRSATGTNKVFLVHGHDNDLKETVARFLMRLQLEPVILHEQPNKGRTIIEKFGRVHKPG